MTSLNWWTTVTSRELSVTLYGILLIEGILHHLGCIKPCIQIAGQIYLSTGAGYFPSTVCWNWHVVAIHGNCYASWWPPILIHSGLGSVFFVPSLILKSNSGWRITIGVKVGRTFLPPNPMYYYRWWFLLMLFNQFQIIQNRWIQSLPILYLPTRLGSLWGKSVGIKISYIESLGYNFHKSREPNASETPGSNPSWWTCDWLGRSPQSLSLMKLKTTEQWKFRLIRL